MPTATAFRTDTRDDILVAGQRLMALKGFSAVGLNEILLVAGVPKGSFYHYFNSKEAFGEAILESYFANYLAELDVTLSRPAMPMSQRLLSYFKTWRETQSVFDCQGKCLAVKLGTEVADLSEAMRQVLEQGTAAIVDRLAIALQAASIEGSLSIEDDLGLVAESLYQLWLGASVMVKITRSPLPFEAAMETTHKILNLPR